MAKKVLVLLSGCGVYDGAEIHESTLTLLSLDQNGIGYQCASPNEEQHHVVNHLNGEEMDTSRNVMVEAARIARGDLKDAAQVSMTDYDGLVIPGGFGSAKNFSKWAFEGPKGEINGEVGRLIKEAHSLGKPILAMCMSPVLLSLAFAGSDVKAKITVGTDTEPSPYEIGAISEGMNSLGAQAQMSSVLEITVDEENSLITTPCYMMEASISQIFEGISKGVSALSKML